MKTFRCNLTKAFWIFTTFTDSLYMNMGILPKKYQEISPVYRDLYTRLYHWFMFEALSLLVCKCDPHSKGYSLISTLHFLCV